MTFHIEIRAEIRVEKYQQFTLQERKKCYKSNIFYIQQKSANHCKYKKNPQPQWLQVFFLFGGAEGSRTPEKSLKNRMITRFIFCVLKFVSKSKQKPAPLSELVFFISVPHTTTQFRAAHRLSALLRGSSGCQHGFPSRRCPGQCMSCLR